MKLTSFFTSILIHLLFILFFILIIKPIQTLTKSKPVYTVNLITIPKKETEAPKPKQKKQIPKSKQKERIKKITANPKVKKAKLKPKTKPKPKPKSKPKPNIERKIQLLREKIIIENIKEKLLREKINALREHVLTQEAAEKAYKQKLAESYKDIITSMIYNNWGVEKSITYNKIFTAEVKIKLDYSGNLVKLKMVKSSGNAYFDGTVIDAIKSSEPFPKPPKDILTSGMVEFIITFDSREKE